LPVKYSIHAAYGAKYPLHLVVKARVCDLSCKSRAIAPLVVDGSNSIVVGRGGEYAKVLKEKSTVVTRVL